MYAHVHLHRRPTLHELSHDDDDVRIASERLLSYNGPEEPHWDPNVGAIGRSRCEVHNRVRESVTVGKGEPVIMYARPWPWAKSTPHVLSFLCNLPRSVTVGEGEGDAGLLAGARAWPRA